MLQHVQNHQRHNYKNVCVHILKLINHFEPLLAMLISGISLTEQPRWRLVVLSGVLPQALKQKTLERIVYIISHDFARSMLIVHNKISVFRTSMNRKRYEPGWWYHLLFPQRAIAMVTNIRAYWLPVKFPMKKELFVVCPNGSWADRKKWGFWGYLQRLT
jgi:hypothetical protein